MPNRLYLTEDYAFCRLARKIGYKSFMSLRFALGHHGVFTFSKESEKEILKEYERMGYIEIKQLQPNWKRFGKRRMADQYDEILEESRRIWWEHEIEERKRRKKAFDDLEIKVYGTKIDDCDS